VGLAFGPAGDQAGICRVAPARAIHLAWWLREKRILSHDDSADNTSGARYRQTARRRPPRLISR
jgi:hypothetical protein